MEAAAPLGLVLLVGCVALPYGTAAAALAVVGPGRTRSGNRLLDRLRAEQHELAPAMSPDWTVHGPQGAALAVGVFGTAAVWASAPALAAELGLPRTAAGDGCRRRRLRRLRVSP